MALYDAILIGAGHNALVCAAYLLKAGYRVLVLEQRSVIGGAATTEELFPQDAPGFFFNLCAIDHEFIHLGPVVEELQLARYGLEYLWCDPVVFCPQWDGSYFLAARDVAKTCAQIARFSPEDAIAYQQFVEFWERVCQIFIPVFNNPPLDFWQMASQYDRGQRAAFLKVMGSPFALMDVAQQLLGSPQQMLEAQFSSEFVRSPLARLAAELGAPPSQKGIAFGAVMMVMRHKPGMARPKGGTGALTQALANLVRSMGGTILAGPEQGVAEVLVDGSRCVGVRTKGGREYFSQRGVISSIDAGRLFLNLIDPTAVDAAAPNLRLDLERKLSNSNEGILKIDCALSGLPKFRGWDYSEEYWMGSVLIADSVEHVERAHADPLVGRIPLDPSLYVVIPSVRDPSLAPPGCHTLWIEFFVPYDLADGQQWTEELKNQTADRCLAKLEEYCPGLQKLIITRSVESPVDLTNRIGVVRGNPYHIDMTFDQMLFFRPLPSLSNYVTPIENLYLTGAGTHPGGSISGMPGRNCAKVFLRQQNLAAPMRRAFFKQAALLFGTVKNWIT